TGMRRAEVLGLKWQWIDLKAKTIHLPGEETKGFSSREVPLNTESVQILRQWHMQHGRPSKGRVFSHSDGAAIQNMKKSFGKLLKDAGIEPTPQGRVTWHSLRHTFGTRLGQGGCDAETLRSLMGHASITTTQRYLHSDDARRRAAVEALSNGQSNES
ncbi:MAG: tyrosine-type recombinase/integrase, partial [Chloroflexota bacterium]